MALTKMRNTLRDTRHFFPDHLYMQELALFIQTYGRARHNYDIETQQVTIDNALNNSDSEELLSLYSHDHSSHGEESVEIEPTIATELDELVRLWHEMDWMGPYN